MEGLPVQGAPPPAVVPVLVQQAIALLPGTESRFAVVLPAGEEGVAEMQLCQASGVIAELLPLSVGLHHAAQTAQFIVTVAGGGPLLVLRRQAPEAVILPGQGGGGVFSFRQSSRGVILERFHVRRMAPFRIGLRVACAYQLPGRVVTIVARAVAHNLRQFDVGLIAVALPPDCLWIVLKALPQQVLRQPPQFIILIAVYQTVPLTPLPFTPGVVVREVRQRTLVQRHSPQLTVDMVVAKYLAIRQSGFTKLPGLPIIDVTHRGPVLVFGATLPLLTQRAPKI